MLAARMLIKILLLILVPVWLILKIIGHAIYIKEVKNVNVELKQKGTAILCIAQKLCAVVIILFVIILAGVIF